MEGVNLSVLLAGYGSIGKRHARILKSLHVRDMRICDPDSDAILRARNDFPETRVYDSFEDGLSEQPDAVFILTPPKFHIPMAIQSLRAGCHVFSEKPVSDSMESIDDLAEAIKASGKKFMVGLCFRYHQGLRKAKHLLDSGKIGRLVSIRALMGEHLPLVRPDYRNLFSSRYLGAFDLMHDIDLAAWYSDQDIRRVGSIYGNHSNIGIEAPDIAEIVIGFENRITATVHLDFFQIPRRRQMELIGTKGVILIDFASWDEYILSFYDNVQETWHTEKEKTKRDDMFRLEDMEFLKAVTDDQPIGCDLKEGCRSLKIVTACLDGHHGILEVTEGNG